MGLKHLHIRDFAVIAELELTFDSGMTVFTGETGAGKSIIVDALGLVLGDRADNTIIRSGCERTEITAIFEIDDDQEIPVKLDEQDIEFDNELILRRVINKDGRSRAYANGSSVPAQFLRELGERMVDIHGQHAHHSLLKRDIQRNLLDEFGQHHKQLNRVRDAYTEWHDATVELAKISGSDQDRDARLSLLQYQVQELEALNVDPAEIAELEAEHTRLANTNRLLEGCQQSLDELTEQEHSVLSRTNHSLHELQELQRFDPSLSSILEMLESASIQISEATDELRRYLDGLDLDPARLKEVEERITSLHDIARKHKIRPEELSYHLNRLQADLQLLQDSEQRFTELQQIQDKALEKYWQLADDLHECRKHVAKKLATDITKKLQELGMPGGRFEIEIEKIEKDKPLREGMDRIEYMVAINPGQSLHPLNKVASGGEQSRISLAIQVIGSRDKGLPTLIFDEVDAGIGGGIAEIVGTLLHKLANKRQVFCVTHLPQVASLGDHHLQVNKSTHAETTLTQVIELNQEERIEEIARMLGGLNITEQSRAHAKEMLNV
ncbi:MAG: DNA repair protein RecN [Gammaproteobacteria bacterium]